VIVADVEAPVLGALHLLVVVHPRREATVASPPVWLMSKHSMRLRRPSGRPEARRASACSRPSLGGRGPRTRLRDREQRVLARHVEPDAALRRAGG